MNTDEKERFIKMEQSVEEIKTDISVIKTALVGNALSNNKGLVGDITILKAEIDILKSEIKTLTEEKIKHREFIRLITWLITIIGAGIIGVGIRFFFK